LRIDIQDCHSEFSSESIVCHSEFSSESIVCHSEFSSESMNKGHYVKIYYIYILASKKHGTLYVGMTNDLVKRIYEHKHKIFEGFTSKYDVDKLVFFEHTNDVQSAIKREKQLKNWHRQWKINLIEKENPNWEDLYYKLI
jgi:putative endonuclease